MKEVRWILLVGVLALAGCVSDAPYPRPYGGPGYGGTGYPQSLGGALPTPLPSGALPIAPQPPTVDVPPPPDGGLAPGSDALRDSPMPDSALRDSPLPDGPVLEAPRADAPTEPPAAEAARPTGDPVTDLLLTPLPQRDAAPTVAAPGAASPSVEAPGPSPAPAAAQRTEPAQAPMMGFRPMRGQTRPSP